MSATTVDVASPGHDTTAPEVSAIAINPASIDVTSGARQIGVNLTISDDLSGLHMVSLRFSPPSAATATSDVDHYQSAVVQCQRAIFDAETSGTVRVGRKGKWSWNDILQIEGCTWPEYSEAGTWVLTYLDVMDMTGNTRCYRAPASVCATCEDYHSYSECEVMSATTVDVASPGGGDTTAPEVSAIAINPASIDVASGARQIGVNLTISDDLSGVHMASMHFLPPSFVRGGVTDFWGYYYDSAFVQCQNAIFDEETSGTVRVGRKGKSSWNDRLQIEGCTWPQYSEAGTWVLTYLEITDMLGNKRRYTAPASVCATCEEAYRYYGMAWRDTGCEVMSATTVDVLIHSPVPSSLPTATPLPTSQPTCKCLDDLKMSRAHVLPSSISPH